MSKRPKLTYANVTATIALFLALGGGAAFAATQLPANSVKAPQIAKNAVGGSELQTGAVHSPDLSQGLATRFQAAVSPFVPPRGDDACAAVYGRKVPANCINVKSKTYSVGFLGSRTFRLSCPAGGVLVPNPAKNLSFFAPVAYVIDTESPHYSGADLPLGARMASFTLTNWSIHRYSFTGYTACLRTS